MSPVCATYPYCIHQPNDHVLKMVERRPRDQKVPDSNPGWSFNVIYSFIDIYVAV